MWILNFQKFKTVLDRAVFQTLEMNFPDSVWNTFVEVCGLSLFTLFSECSHYNVADRTYTIRHVSLKRIFTKSYRTVQLQTSTLSRLACRLYTSIVRRKWRHDHLQCEKEVVSASSVTVVTWFVSRVTLKKHKVNRNTGTKAASFLCFIS